MNNTLLLMVVGLLCTGSISLCEGDTQKMPVTPSWNSLGDLDIVPCPKQLAVSENKFLLADKKGARTIIVIPDNFSNKIKVATEIVNKSIVERGFQALKVKKELDLKEDLPEGVNIILLTTKGKSKLLDPALKEARLELDDYPLEEQGYVIHFLSGKNRDKVLLTGLDEQGLLYAAVTFAELIDRENQSLVAKTVNIIDWPDFKHRMGHGLRLINLEGAKEIIDWFLKYKFNLFMVYYGDGDSLGMKYWPMVEEINSYGQDRGIRIVYFTTWSIGNVKDLKETPDFKECVQYGGEFYCWSQDQFLEERIEGCKSFVKKTGTKAMAFHCVDSYDENWSERCDGCRSRFGDDRASADAHVINLFTQGLRSVDKDILLAFVTQPYSINLNLRGNERYKEYYTKLSSLIPADVFLTTTEYDHDAGTSWYETISQPVIRWQNGATFQWGRFFDSQPCLFKGVYFPDRGDIAFLNEPVGFFEGEIMSLVGIEYMWNTEAPGSLVEKNNPKSPIKERGPYKYQATQVGNVDFGDWVRHKSTKEPVDTCNILLERVCRKLFGISAGPYISRYLREGVKGWRAPSVARELVRDWKEAEEEYHNAERAYQILKEGMEKIKASAETSVLRRFIERTIHPKVFYSTYSLALHAEEEVKKRNLSLAGELASECVRELEEAREELKNEGVYRPESENWLKFAEEKIRLIQLKIRTVGGENMIRNSSFEETKDGRIDIWQSTALTVSVDAHTGKNAGKLTLLPEQAYVDLSQELNLMVQPGAEYYVEFWVKKDGGCRVVPQLVFWPGDYTKRIEIAVTDFPYYEEVKEYTNYFGVIKAPEGMGFGKFRIYFDWFGGAKSAPKNLFIDDVVVRKVTE